MWSFVLAQAYAIRGWLVLLTWTLPPWSGWRSVFLGFLISSVVDRLGRVGRQKRIGYRLELVGGWFRCFSSRCLEAFRREVLLPRGCVGTPCSLCTRRWRNKQERIAEFCVHVDPTAFWIAPYSVSASSYYVGISNPGYFVSYLFPASYDDSIAFRLDPRFAYDAHKHDAQFVLVFIKDNSRRSQQLPTRRLFWIVKGNNFAEHVQEANLSTLFLN